MRPHLPGSKSLIVRHLEKEEGIRLDPYRDSEGYWTIGVGHLIDRRKGGSLPKWIRASFPLDLIEVHQLLLRDIAEVEVKLFDKKPEIRELDEVRRTIIVSMAFQMGVPGLLKFRNTLSAVLSSHWQDARYGMLDSKWATQTPERANRMALAMVSGDETYLELT